MPSEKEEHLTREQKEQLEAELAQLEGPRRAKIEQGLLERRTRMLRDRLDRAVIVDEEAAAASGTIGVGSKVEIEDERGEKLQIQISSVDGVSPDSPVGRALLG